MVGILQWLADARNGDHQAWEKLHRSLQPYLLNQAQRHLLNQAQRHLGPDWPERSVQDLIQETWPHFDAESVSLITGIIL
jgi:hypothetical protein